MRALKAGFLLCACVVLLAARPACAQGADEEAGRAAQQAGQYREAFTRYMAAWRAALSAYDQNRSTANDQAVERIRLAIFQVVRRLDPQPAIPDGTIGLEGRAEAAIKAAQNPRDYGDANEAYRLAIRQAPWVPRLYFNRSVVAEKTGDNQGAVTYLTYYLQAAPDADDATEVKKKIGGLQYLLDKATAAKEAIQSAADQQARAAEQATGNLAGTWIASAGNRAQYVVTRTGKQIAMILMYVDWGQGWRMAPSGARFVGSIQGFQITGEYSIENAKNISSPGDGTFTNGSFTATIGADGRTMAIQYPFRGYTAGMTLTKQ